MGQILIAGGGLVGLATALALAARGQPCSVAEARADEQAKPEQQADTRHLALAHGSILALQWLGVWPDLQAQAAPLREIHVSRQGALGQVLLSAAEHGYERFGAVVPAPALLEALTRRAQQQSAIEWLRPARVCSSSVEADARTLCLQDGSERRVALLVIAEGSESPLREAVGLKVDRHDYRRSLISCAVRSSQPPQGRAWERLAAAGPMALLPRSDGRHGLVWTVPGGQAEALMAADEASFLAAFQDGFGYRPGRFRACGRRSRWPLRRVWAEQLAAPRAVLVGNAAQSLHPIGAQGFNLGLRDALCLAAQVAGAPDPGAAALLQAHAEARRPDREATRDWTAALLAARPGPSLLAPLAGAAMLAMDLAPALQRRLVERAMGLEALRWIDPAALRAA